MFSESQIAGDIDAVGDNGEWWVVDVELANTIFAVTFTPKQLRGCARSGE